MDLFEVKTINELCCKITDGAHFSPSEEQNGEFPMYSSKDMLYDGFDDKDVKMISKTDYDKLVKQDCRPLTDDILIIKDGNNYLKQIFKVKKTLDAVILSSIAILRPQKSIINPDYFIFVLRTGSVRKAMSNYVSGAAIPRVVLKDFKKMKLRLHKDLVIQRKIASILSTYDSLIENNTKRIKLLEQMAENLYKEWFVRFRFPGHENVGMENSKLGKIPSTFSVTNMGSVIDYYIGGGWGNDEYSNDFPVQASVIRGADFPSVTNYDVSTCPNRFHKVSNYKSRQLQAGDIVMEISGGTSEQPVGRTVLVTQDLIDRFDEGKLICASFCKLLRLKKDMISPYFFYYWMQYLYDTRIIDRFQLQSTGIINFKFESFLKGGTVLIPPTELMKAFDKHIIPLLNEVNSLAKQNQQLIRQRDLLLPRLMSGKLEVKA